MTGHRGVYLKGDEMMMRMTKIASLMILLVCLTGFSTAVRAQDVGWVGDLPVPAKALINTKSAVAFDSPSGRVVRFSFHSDFDEAQMISFYNQTLANLGWQALDKGFARDGEMMVITKTGTSSQGQLIYQLSLTPRS